MIEDIVVGVMVVVVLTAAVFGWWFENGQSNSKEKDSKIEESIGDNQEETK